MCLWAELRVSKIGSNMVSTGGTFHCHMDDCNSPKPRRFETALGFEHHFLTNGVKPSEIKAFGKSLELQNWIEIR